MVCAQCGSQLPENSRFCIRCGYPVGPAAPGPDAPAAPPELERTRQPLAGGAGSPASRSTWPLLVSIAAVLVIVACLAVTWTVRSLVASRAGEGEGESFVGTIDPRNLVPGNIAAGPRGADGRPFTAARRSGFEPGPLQAGGSSGTGSRNLAAAPPPSTVAPGGLTVAPGAVPIAPGQLPAATPARPFEPGPIAAAPRPAPSASPAPRPLQAAPAPPPAPQGMPPDVWAYLCWLSQVDIGRNALDSEALAALPQYLPQLLTAGLGLDPGAVNPLPELARQFNAWHAELTRFSRRFQRLEGLPGWQQRAGIRGPARVPQPCRNLHARYGQALTAQTGAAGELAAAMLAGRIDRAMKMMAASGRTQQILEAADREVGAICARYATQQWFNIQVVPGQTTLPPIGLR